MTSKPHCHYLFLLETGYMLLTLAFLGLLMHFGATRVLKFHLRYAITVKQPLRLCNCIVDSFDFLFINSCDLFKNSLASNFRFHQYNHRLLCDRPLFVFFPFINKFPSLPSFPPPGISGKGIREKVPCSQLVRFLFSCRIPIFALRFFFGDFFCVPGISFSKIDSPFSLDIL